MLVLSRKVREKLRIGPNGHITVEVLEIRGNQVRLGVTAPPDVHVTRPDRKWWQGSGDLFQNCWDEEAGGMTSRCVRCGFVARSGWDAMKHTCPPDAQTTDQGDT